MIDLEEKYLEEIKKIADSPIRPDDDKLLGHAPSRSVLEGNRYIAAVPDTLDLADRLELAIIPATNRYYPEERWHMGFMLFAMRPFALFRDHTEGGWLSMPPKAVQALIYCRHASGNDINIEVDRKILATQLGLIGKDGLSYSPSLPADGKEHPEYDFPDRACVWTEGRWLQTLALLMQIDDSPVWLDLAKRKVEKLLELTLEEDGYRYFDTRYFIPGQSADKTMTEADAADNDPANKGSVNFFRSFSLGAVCHGAAQIYMISGFGPALELCRGMVRWAMKKIYTREDGIYLVEHFYHGVYPLIGMAEYAEITGDKEVLRRVDACYRWVRDMGEPLVGFYSGDMPGGQNYIKEPQEYMEICALSNMSILALHLSRSGAGDYWDDIDRWTRNTYAESQMTDLGIMDLPDSLFSPAKEEGSYSHGMNTRSMEARSIGSWFTTISGNDLGIMRNGKYFGAAASCCITNGPRALYCVWDSIVVGNGEGVRINLMLNRASEWVDVNSYIPVEGRVSVKVKKTKRVDVRIPEWVDISSAKTCLNGKNIVPDITGRYIQIADVIPGDVIEVLFPMPEERTVNRIIGSHPYRLTIKGANVVKIYPPGIVQPFYTKHPQGKLIEKERFVSDKKLIW